MYKRHFSLAQRPFAITPDPRYLYLSPRHREALAHLLYGVGDGGGFVQLTGEVGTGKTTLCRALLEQLPQRVDVALILNPRLDAIELVAAVCDELGAPYPAGSRSLKVLVGALNEHLLRSHAAGRRTVLIIDEAQNLSADVLEQLRLLTNLETAEIKLLQIVLIGQPELRDMLARPELRQLAQRVTARYHLDPLTAAESVAYVQHRLRVAGATAPLFDRAALRLLHRLSGGVPRLINLLCDRALLGAYAEGRQQVDGRILRRAAREVRTGGAGAAPRRTPAAWAIGAGLAVMLLAGGGWYLDLWLPAPGGGGAPLAAVPAPATAGSVAEAGPVAMASAEPGLPARLAALGDHPDGAAWAALSERWALPLDTRRPPCDQAAAAGLRCHGGAGNWTLLRRLGLPALLRLRDGDGRHWAVVLASLGAADAELEYGGARLVVGLAAIEPYWYGDYELLWRPPIHSELLRLGDRSTDVAWLREQLDRLLPPPGAAGDPLLFDDELARRVMAFQAGRGLRADGIVGQHTLLHLSSASAPAETPRLDAAERG